LKLSCNIFPVIDLSEQFEVKACFVIIFLIAIMFLIVILLEFPICRKLTGHVPLSACLLFTGILLGYLITMYGELNADSMINNNVEIPYYLIQHLLISPILLQSSYQLYHPKFFSQFTSVMMLAILGTILNILLVAAILRLCYVPLLMVEMNMYHLLAFCSVISAVDPVAVLATFECINADRGLYYLLFGEALFNDGVTFVFYESVYQIAKLSPSTDVPILSFLCAGLFLFTAPIGGFLVGFVCGALSAFITKLSTENSEVFQITLIFIFAGLGYFLSMAFGFSCVIGIISTGLTQMRYAIPNLTPQNQMTVSKITETVATFCEMLIFVILGSEMNTVNLEECWSFVLIVFVVITIVRLAVTFGLITLLNQYRTNPVSFNMKIVIFMGGLRGAFSFVMILSYDGPFRSLYHNTVLLIIILTNTVYGIATKPLVNYMKLQEKERGKEETFVGIMKYVNTIVKHSITTLSADQDTHEALKLKLYYIERKYIFKKLSKSNSGQERFFRDFDKYEQEEAMKLVKAHNVVSLLKTSRLAERLEPKTEVEPALAFTEDEVQQEVSGDYSTSERSVERRSSANV